jgi:serine/threonine protein kinase
VSLKKLGRYDLVRVLGKGAMGIVYEGRDPNLDRHVAIKTVKVENLSEEAAAEYEARFRTEARSAARLQHPNIVSVYDSDRDGDIAFLVMEYIQGDDLKHHLDRGIRYSLEQSLKMIRDLLSALDYAHKQGIVHRDIKPANLLIEPGGRVKLTDFGVARIQDSGEATRTQGSMIGTLKYMSPEQVQGLKIDSRADLFSVGVVLYQLLTDKRPFDGDNDFSIIHQIIGHAPAPPSSFNARLPAAIDAVVSRALAKDRDQRFATARDFAAALQSAIRRAEDATVVPPADPLKKTDGVGTASKTGASVVGSGTGSSATSGSTATVTQELELVYWKDIKDSTDSEELQGFLVKFPEGIYADLARRRLRKLAGGPDHTGLNSTPARAAAEQDLEATRMRDPSQPMASDRIAAVRAVAPAPHTVSAQKTAAAADAAADTTATVSEPRNDETHPVAAAVAVASAQATPVQSAPVPAQQAPRIAGEASAIRPRRRPPIELKVPEPKRPPIAIFAGIGLLAVAGLTGLFLVGKGGSKTLVAAAPAASQIAPAPSTVVAPAPVSAPALVTVAAEPAAVPAVVPPVAAAAPAVAAPEPAPRRGAVGVNAPARPASAPRPRRTASAPAALSSNPVATAQPQPESRREVRPAVSPPAASARLVSPAETCKDRVFLSKQYCLIEECAKPGFQSFPVCVRLREEARLREDSKIRN